jgi:TatD DNase family protein
MFCDSHCHPFDLLRYLDKEDLESCRKETAWAASAWNLEQFEYHESLAKKAGSQGDYPPLLLCFAVHPQLPASLLSQKKNSDDKQERNYDIKGELLPLLESLAREKRLDAVGETGFDLYNEEYRETEKIQDEIFAFHLEIAVKYDLPMVIHSRRAMHKIFGHTKNLRKVRAVIFHSWPGTPGEGQALLKRGVNAYFSFGAAIVNGRKESQRSCALLPAERLLLETDAPYLPPKGKEFSTWADLPLICQKAAELRQEADSPFDTFAEIETLCEANFFRAFSKRT